MFRVIASCSACLLLIGCRNAAPIHVWQPPILASTVGKQVVISAVAGPREVSEPLKEQLLASTPKDAGRAVTLIDAESMAASNEIRLVSATDNEPSELALASESRHAGADFLLRGEVLGVDQPLRVSWRLLSLADDGEVAGMPIVVDLDSSLQRYPDLGLIIDPQRVTVAAAARDTFRLITPWIDRRSVRLSQSFLLPGSRDVRRGNFAARAGRWAEAQAIWQSVWDRNPTQVAALHNLALASAAEQDFSRAKELARRAVRLCPTPLYKNTLVWIELMQRDYHESFNLPDPPEGWFVSRPSKSQ